MQRAYWLSFLREVFVESFRVSKCCREECFVEAVCLKWPLVLGIIGGVCWNTDELVCEACSMAEGFCDLNGAP